MLKDSGFKQKKAIPNEFSMYQRMHVNKTVGQYSIDKKPGRFTYLI